MSEWVVVITTAIAFRDKQKSTSSRIARVGFREEMRRWLKLGDWGSLGRAVKKQAEQ